MNKGYLQDFLLAGAGLAKAGNGETAGYHHPLWKIWQGPPSLDAFHFDSGLIGHSQLQ
jgi:hypothetical protein